MEVPLGLIYKVELVFRLKFIFY